MFELTQNEASFLKCQIGTSSWGGTRYLPFAFTEQGVAQLSRGYAELHRKIEDFMLETNTQFNEIYQLLDEFTAHKKELGKPQNRIGFVLR
jgi:hypothetical protein